MASEFTRQEKAIIARAIELSEGDYEMRRNYFKEVLHRLYSYRNDHHSARLVYAIGSNLVLDESDIIDFVTDIWGISEDRFHSMIW